MRFFVAYEAYSYGRVTYRGNAVIILSKSDVESRTLPGDIVGLLTTNNPAIWGKEIVITSLNPLDCTCNCEHE